MKKKLVPVFVAVAFILVIIVLSISVTVIKKYTPGKEMADLSEYYHVEAEDDLCIILNHEITEENGKYIDGYAYLTYEFVYQYLNATFYWDENENILRYTTPSDVISVNASSKEYFISKEKHTKDYTIVRVDGDQMYLAVNFVQDYTNIDFSVYENPNRLMITSEWGEITTATLKKDTEIRLKGGIKSPIVSELQKKEPVTILEQLEDWAKVITADGMIGYLKTKTLGKSQTQILDRDFPKEEFTHLLKDEKISMAWHQVHDDDDNEEIHEYLQGTKGINVISPTWFYLDDNQGNIQSRASTDYVEYCHRNEIEVWGLFSNLENTEVDTNYVLTHTSIRDYLVNQIVSAAIEYNLDGINMDFESLDGDIGDAYVQLIRELSVKCRKNHIVLSVDNYVPTDYTAFYNRKEQAVFADYIIIMGYDEHYSGSEEGSVASIGFVTNGVKDTLEEVPPKQTILGMPFYTRVWECIPKDAASEAEMASEDYVPYTVDSSAVSMIEAQKRAEENGAEKVWLEEAGQHYVEYGKEGVTYKIWMEDEASMELRLQLIKENNLAGAAYWKLGLEKDSIWDLIIKYIN